jgi:hypothetical protein
MTATIRHDTDPPCVYVVRKYANHVDELRYPILRDLGEGPGGARLLECTREGHYLAYLVVWPDGRHAMHSTYAPPEKADRPEAREARTKAIQSLYRNEPDPYAGWRYGRSGVCFDRTLNAHYPWHEPHGDTCRRCGIVEPPDGLPGPRSAAPTT